MEHRKHITARGFTMFFAVLVASLALAIGLAIYDLVVRELQLSSTTSQSEYAIYAADTGVECALYWDYKYNGNNSIFPTSTADMNARNATGAYCNGQDITQSRQLSTTANGSVSTSTISALSAGSQANVVIVVVKSLGGSSQTVLTPTSGGSVTDSGGNVWTLQSDQCIYENGVKNVNGCGTSELTYVSSTDTIWGQDNNSGGWYYWDGANWIGPSGNTPIEPDVVNTTIYSHGYNTASSSPAAVERELQVTY